MPRLVQSNNNPTFGSLGNELVHYGLPSSENNKGSSSVRLCCLSPNGREVHSLSQRDSLFIIETHSLPLVGTVEGVNDSIYGESIPSIVRTYLPSQVRAALERYAAVELLCVDVESPSSSTTKSGELKKFPKLCLYTRKDVFILDIGYIPTPGIVELEGVVVSVKEPFDEFLLGTSTSTKIIRVRQAPQRHMGYATMSPPECIAMLTRDSGTNEYNLSLYHGNSSVGTPLVYGMEQFEEPTERITDFCFCQSTAFPLLSSITVAFLKGGGDVFFATPIIFRGTVVPRESVAKTLDYINQALQRANQYSPRWKQLRVAKQYIIDTFPDDGRGPFLTAQERSEAFAWPVKMQGPVLLAPESDDFETLAYAVEPVFAGDLVGIVIGHLGHKIEFGIVSPTTLIPRFRFEHEDDTLQLDHDLTWGAIVNRVDLRDDESDRRPNCESLALIRDPIIDTLVHYVTPSAIKSISTNTVKITANQLQPKTRGSMFSPPSKRKDVEPRTTAWSCLDVVNMPDQRQYVGGAVVSGDVNFGHVLVSRLSDGSMVAVNLTETRQWREMETLVDNEDLGLGARGASVSQPELSALHDSSPLIELVEPIVKRVLEGIRHMSIIVGSATPTKDISPELLAAVISIKEKCDQDVVLPILEMNEVINARKKELAIMYNNQVEQLKSLMEQVSKVRQRTASIHEKAQVVRTNAQSLSQRSTSVLQSSTDLLPTILQAEFDYFQELKRLDEKTKFWSDELEQIKLTVACLSDAIEDKRTAGQLSLPDMQAGNSTTLLSASGTLINQYKLRLGEVEEKIDDLAAIVGIDGDLHGLSRVKQ